MIIDDNVYETQECFMAVLELPTGSTGVQLGQQSQANVVLFDDDGTPNCAYYYYSYIIVAPPYTRAPMK